MTRLRSCSRKTVEGSGCTCREVTHCRPAPTRIVGGSVKQKLDDDADLKHARVQTLPWNCSEFAVLVL